MNKRPAPYTPERVLPDGTEIARRRKAGETFASIGEQYGTSRQAVHKAFTKWTRDQEEEEVKA